MDQEQMIIDPEVLYKIRELIQGYASKQKEALNKLERTIKSLSSDWDDPRSYGDMSKQISTVCKNAVGLIEQIRNDYRKYYYDEILAIKKTLAGLKV